jgi:hypothetical protein
VKSRGGKIEYLCCECRSANIGKFLCYGQVSFMCLDCNHFAPWRWRLKVRSEENNKERK